MKKIIITIMFLLSAMGIKAQTERFIYPISQIVTISGYKVFTVADTTGVYYLLEVGTTNHYAGSYLNGMGAWDFGVIGSGLYELYSGTYPSGSKITSFGIRALPIKLVNADNITSGTLNRNRLPDSIDVTKIGNGDISLTEFNYLNGLTSNIQNQLASKTDTNIVTSELNLKIPYKSYKVLISATDTAKPVLSIEFQNEFSDSIQITRISQGYYRVHSVGGEFPNGLCFVNITGGHVTSLITDYSLRFFNFGSATSNNIDFTVTDKDGNLIDGFFNLWLWITAH